MKIPFLITFLFCGFASFCQPVFSPVQCQDLNNKSISFPPGAAENTPENTIVVVTFSDKASDELKTWIDPLYQKFIARSGLMDELFDASLWMLSYVSGTELTLIKINADKIKKDLPKQLVNSVLYTTASPQSLKDGLKVKNEKSVYILVLSPDGKILKQVSGNYSDDKMESIEDVL